MYATLEDYANRSAGGGIPQDKLRGALDRQKEEGLRQEVPQGGLTS